MMQRNEGRMLRAWIDHYASITSPDLITIIDNGSHEIETKTQLEYAKNIGLNVNYDYSDPVHFKQKGQIIGQELSKLAAEAEFLLPCDCDEFLTVDPSNNNHATLSNILDQLSLTNKNNFRISNSFYNIPESNYFYYSHCKKMIFRSELPDVVDTGFHFFDWGQNVDLLDDIVSTNLAFIHYHNKPFGQLIRAAREKLKFRVNSFRNEELKTYNGEGRHLVDYFLMDESKYMERFNNHKKIASEDLLLSAAIVDYQASSSPAKINVSDYSVFRLKGTFNHAKHYDKIAMTKSEIDFYFSNLLNSRKSFEYGLGGSTFLACNSDVPTIGSVESDFDFCAQTISKLGLQSYIDVSRLKIYQRSLGETKDWGYPISKVPLEIAKAYCNMENEFTDSTTVLIDGRYRVCCAASVYIQATNVSPTVFVHDFPNRDHYKEVLEIYNVVNIIDSLACLTPRPNCRDVAMNLRDHFALDPR